MSVFNDDITVVNGGGSGIGPAQPSAFADLLRSVSDGVAMTNTREQIIAALNAFALGCQTNDIDARVALFAPELIFEDPRGISRAANHAELREFFVSATGGGLVIERSVEDRIVIHDEAIERNVITLHLPDQVPVYIRLYTHFAFDPTGFITSYRVFFDRDSITT